MYAVYVYTLYTDWFLHMPAYAISCPDLAPLAHILGYVTCTLPLSFPLPFLPLSLLGLLPLPLVHFVFPSFSYIHVAFGAHLIVTIKT